MVPPLLDTPLLAASALSCFVGAASINRLANPRFRWQALDVLDPGLAAGLRHVLPPILTRHIAARVRTDLERVKRDAEIASVGTIR